MKTALLFAGQGAQAVGMGKDLCARYECAREIFESADRVLGRDLSKICFEGPETELTKTVNAQPGIFVASLACMEALRFLLSRQQAKSWPWRFEAAAGLSLGEFTALVAAGALSFDDGLKLVQQRGQFMQEACDAASGAMASVMGMNEADCADICREADVDMANLNCPGQIVISGDKDKIAKAVQLAKERGAKRAIPLNVAGAYHSRLMTPAQTKLAAVLQQVEVHPPRVTVVSNVTARPVTQPDEIRAALTRQVTGSVRWEDSMRYLLAQGFSRFIELGPGNVLGGLMKRINPDKLVEGNKAVEIMAVTDCASLEAVAGKLGAPAATTPEPTATGGAL